MYNLFKDHSLSKEEFERFPFNNNIGVLPQEESKREDTNNYDVGLAVVPFARSSKTVRRNSEYQHQQEYGCKYNLSDSLFPSSTSAIPKKFPWESIGHASREQSKDEIRVEPMETKPFPFGVFSNKVVARRGSPSHSPRSANCTHITKEGLPHPSKLIRRKKYSNSRQKRFGLDVEAHVAQLRRKHVEFKWVPKGISSNDSYLVCPEQDEIVQQERTLQKVPSSSSPISRNQLWSSVTPGIYSDSPNKTWIQEDYSLLRASRRPWSPGASDTGISKEDQTIPNTNGLFEPGKEDVSYDDFHLISFSY